MGPKVMSMVRRIFSLPGRLATRNTMGLIDPGSVRTAFERRVATTPGGDHYRRRSPDRYGGRLMRRRFI